MDCILTANLGVGSPYVALRNKDIIANTKHYLEPKLSKEQQFIEKCKSRFWSLRKAWNYYKKATDDMASLLVKCGNSIE